MKAAILGTTGYTGLVLLRSLLKHPEIHEIIPVSSSTVGENICDYDAGIDPKALKKKVPGGKLVSLEEALESAPEVVFAALPHLKSAELCAPFFGRSVVIDLSADFRIEDSSLFQKAYGQNHPDPEMQKHAVYGLTEWYKDEIKKSGLIANPGCYPTASLLPLLPLFHNNLIGSEISINALSGISGAGRSAKPGSLFVKRSENACAYNAGTRHRHHTEIKKELDKNGSSEADLLFTPHLIPIRRGMFVSTIVKLTKQVTNEELKKLYSDAYGDSPFVNIRENGTIPETADVAGSNRCDISWQLEGDKLLLFSVIDNLVKGASGQAIQNMNVRFGFDESAGLETDGAL